MRPYDLGKLKELIDITCINEIHIFYVVVRKYPVNMNTPQDPNNSECSSL